MNLRRSPLSLVFVLLTLLWVSTAQVVEASHLHTSDAAAEQCLACKVDGGHTLPAATQSLSLPRLQTAAPLSPVVAVPVAPFLLPLSRGPPLYP